MNKQSSNSTTILWSIPRSVSTAFERAIVELSFILNKEKEGKMEVFHEPLSKPYYYHYNQGSKRFPVKENIPSYNYIIDKINNSKAEYVFSKDMAYYVKNKIPDLVTRNINHTFIIRNPTKTIPSLYKATFNSKGSNQKYDSNLEFDINESGFIELLEVFNYVKNELKQTPIVIDSDDLLEKPVEYMKKYCKLVNLPWNENMITWEPGIVPSGWEEWDGWHNDAINSSGLVKRTIITHRYQKELEIPCVKKAIELSLPAYNEIIKYKIKI